MALFSLSVVTSNVLSFRPDVLWRKTPAWASVCIISDVTTQRVLGVCSKEKHTHISTRLLSSTSASVELVINAEVRPGDIIRVQEDGYGFPRVLCDQLLQSLRQFIL